MSRSTSERNSGELANNVQKMTSYSVAFLSPDPVTMYLSSFEMSLQSTDDDSFDYNRCTQTLVVTERMSLMDNFLWLWLCSDINLRILRLLVR